VQALAHLQRFEREYPGHESRSRASLWLARLLFDRKNEPGACAALATARAAASPEDIELRNQIDYYGQRCMGVDTAGAAPPTPVPTAPATPTAAPRSALPSSQSSQPMHDGRRDTSARNSVAPEETAGSGYTVQVAAYDTRAAAEELIQRLRARDYAARLASSARPFRVRVGRYDTRADAVAAQQRLKEKGIEGFVTKMER
jgi:cell division septation protein DedD